MGKNCRNLFNTGEQVVQGYSEEITSKVQKYARMSVTQFVPYSYGELTIELTYIIHSNILVTVKKIATLLVFYQACECSKHRSRPSEVVRLVQPWPDQIFPLSVQNKPFIV